MPYIDIGGVEKNFFLISNFLARNVNDVVVITISKKSKKFLNKNIKFLKLNLDFWERTSKRIKYFLSLFLLTKEVLKIKILQLLVFKQIFIVDFYQNY